MDQIAEHSVTASARIVELSLNLSERFIIWLATSGLRILLIVALGWTAMRVITGLMTRLHKVMVGSSVSIERVQRADTITGILRTVSLIFVLAVVVMMVLNETGINIGPVLATAGIGGLAIGFGAQTLVKDVISGFFLLVEDQMRIGDVVEVGGKSGVVESINLRTVRLRDVAGGVHIVPNGSVTIVTNLTRDFSRYVFDIPLARKEDPDRVFEVLRGIGEEMQKDPAFAGDILQPLEILGVDAVAAATVTVKARITTRVTKQWRVGREFNRRMKKKFDELGIAGA